MHDHFPYSDRTGRRHVKGNSRFYSSVISTLGIVATCAYVCVYVCARVYMHCVYIAYKKNDVAGYASERTYE